MEEKSSEKPRKNGRETPMILDVKMKKGENVMQNFLIDLTEIANTESIPANAIPKKFRSSPQGNKKTALISARLTSQSEYRFIPNNFKQQTGVAFDIANGKINFEAGVSGIQNMGNTCFFSACKSIYFHYINSRAVSFCCATTHRFLLGRAASRNS